jgi:hypothetical protein
LASKRFTAKGEIKAWYGDEVNFIVRNHVKRGMRQAVQLAVKIAKEKVNRSQPTKAVGSGRIGLDPSKPGEPPKVVTSHLKRNIRGKVKSSPNMVQGFIGGNLVYMRALELGSRASRSGYGGVLRPRPFLRPTILENRPMLLKVISNG